MAVAVAAFLALLAPASAQDNNKLKAALSACMKRAVLDPLPIIDVDDGRLSAMAATVKQRSICSPR